MANDIDIIFHFSKKFYVIFYFTTYIISTLKIQSNLIPNNANNIKMAQNKYY